MNQPDPTETAVDTCPDCQHPRHLPGTECESRVHHGRNFHVCLCLARPGAALACPPQMTCQGGTLGYTDIWYLQRGHSLSGTDGVISPEVLRLDPTRIATPPDPTTDRRDQYAAPLYALMRQNGWDGERTEPVVREMDLVLDAVIAVADAEQAELRAAAFEEAAEKLAGLEPEKAVLAGQSAWKTAAGIVRHMAVQERRMADGEQPPAAPVVPPAPTSRAADRQQIIEALYEARRPGLGGMTEADAVAHMADAVLRRLAAVPAAEEQPENETPCSAPNSCDSDELCPTHEEAKAHAEGEHAFCGPTCEVEFPSDKLRNTILHRALPGAAGMLDELLRRAATPSAVVPQPEEADRVVAHFLAVHTAALHCLVCAPPPWGDIWTPVTAGELEDGGICSKCGADVLIPLPATEQP